MGRHGSDVIGSSHQTRTITITRKWPSACEVDQTEVAQSGAHLASSLNAFWSQRSGVASSASNHLFTNSTVRVPYLKYMMPGSEASGHISTSPRHPQPVPRPDSPMFMGEPANAGSSSPSSPGLMVDMRLSLLTRISASGYLIHKGATGFQPLLIPHPRQIYSVSSACAGSKLASQSSASRFSR